MKQLKKYAIGYNTVSSKNGVISARGVKSKANNMEIYGYTHEIGTGKKSPDNPYQLVSLDSGAMNVDGVDYEHSIKLSNNDMSIQVPIPIALNSVEGVCDKIVKKEDVYYVEQNIKKFIIDENIKNVYFILQEQANGIIKFATRFPDMDGKIISKNKIICNKLPSYYENMNFYEHIRNSYADYPNSVILYISISRMTENDTVTEDEILAYLKDNHIEVLYQVENPYYLKLSDYAQDLLNSFTLQNNNKIWVEGNPDLKISGYIQK